jgi:putative transposase
MKELHQASRGSAGARTLSALMCREGKAVGRYKAGQLTKEAGLVSRQPGNHRYRVCDGASLLNRCFTVEEPDRVWCGGITLIRTGTG